MERADIANTRRDVSGFLYTVAHFSLKTFGVAFILKWWISFTSRYLHRLTYLKKLCVALHNVVGAVALKILMSSRHSDIHDFASQILDPPKESHVM
jgi:hypothetical protein